HAVGLGSSSKYEDASIIIMEDHKSPNQLVDEYFDELKPDEIDCLLNYGTKTGSGTYSEDYENHTLFRDAANERGLYDSVFNLAEINGHYFNSNYTDEQGNI